MPKWPMVRTKLPLGLHDMREAVGSSDKTTTGTSINV